MKKPLFVKVISEGVSLMNKESQFINLMESLKKCPPKVIGGYKRQGWAVKVLDNISNGNVEKEGDGSVIAKAVLQAKDQTYYPAFLTLDLTKKGQITGAYFISDNKEQYDLIPFEIAKHFLNKTEQELLPFKYRTLVQIPGDEIQKNWPDFT